MASSRSKRKITGFSGNLGTSADASSTEGREIRAEDFDCEGSRSLMFPDAAKPNPKATLPQQLQSCRDIASFHAV